MKKLKNILTGIFNAVLGAAEPLPGDRPSFTTVTLKEFGDTVVERPQPVYSRRDF